MNEKQQLLFETLQGFKYDPEAFILYVFPWGVKGTPLEKYPSTSSMADENVCRYSTTFSKRSGVKETLTHVSSFLLQYQ
ncbi:MAG: hypothetical protein KZQ60_04235 [Candidatus Thiodiazotropha sp. (ex Lucinoma aequizonata)]|nr:hypothetical protein [Candidatus Thiodiazotropha sp. (ex Lucinoma aequizonata)]